MCGVFRKRDALGNRVQGKGCVGCSEKGMHWVIREGCTGCSGRGNTFVNPVAASFERAWSIWHPTDFWLQESCWGQRWPHPSKLLRMAGKTKWGADTVFTLQLGRPLIIQMAASLAMESPTHVHGWSQKYGTTWCLTTALQRQRFMKNTATGVRGLGRTHPPPPLAPSTLWETVVFFLYPLKCCPLFTWHRT